MADELKWPAEVIPDTDWVFMRAHQIYFPEGELEPGVFKDHNDGMSVNLDKYATAEQTKLQAKQPHKNAIITTPVIGIRKIKPLGVEHTPELENRAHSDVRGLPRDHEQLTETRISLLRISKIVLPLTP